MFKICKFDMTTGVASTVAITVVLPSLVYARVVVIKLYNTDAMCKPAIP